MGQTDAGGGKKKKMKERARRKGRKEGGRSGNLFARTRNWFWFSFSGWTDGRRLAGLWRGERAGCPPGRGRSDN